jgi:lambda family phage portal protein
VKASVDYTVGEGITYQARVKTPEGKLDRKTNQKIEDAFSRWADEADISGKLHYYEIMRLAKRQDVEPGEFLIVKTLSKNRNRQSPFALQMFEADWLASSKDGSIREYVEIDQGIEYNKFTGEVYAYHFVDPDGWGKTIRIEADKVLHGFEMLRPGQLRGISPLAAGVLVAHSLSEYMGTEIDAAKMAAKYLAMIKTANVSAFQAGMGATLDADTNQKIESLEGAIIQYMRPGEEVTLATNPRPGTNFPPFVKLVLCMFSAIAGVPYEIISCDYGGLNYSVSRTVRNDFAAQLKPIARRHIRQFCLKTQVPAINWLVMAGSLSLPGFDRDPYHYLRSEWKPPGMESLDPLKENKAHNDGIKGGIRSPQEVVRARGRELEDVYREIADAKDLAEEMGLSFEEETSTALANNPAALGDDDED